MKRLVTILIFALLPALFAAPARAGGDVGVCDEAHLLAALSGGGTVTFSCSGTITLSSTIGIAEDTTIDGGGQDVTISGGDSVHVLNIAGGTTLNLKDLTVAGGYGGPFTGGGGVSVSSFATLNATRTTFTGNSAATGGAINNHGTVNITDSTFSYNSATGTSYVFAGGALYNGSGGNATISGSTFYGNVSNIGGGIYTLDGLVSVSNSTFSGNMADPGTGGAVRVADGGTMIVVNSTFSGNSAGIFPGGGAIDNGGSITLKNSLVANSVYGGNCLGTITDGGGNLSYPDTTCPGLNADPLLGPLQDNGGPTWTTALQAGSAAIDQADDAVCAGAPVYGLDQRNVARPIGLHCDIGAFEAAGPSGQPYRIYLPLILRVEQ